jgi:hypothetical protein
MSKQIEFRVWRGTNAERAAITPADGELFWTIDTNLLYCGDGSTAGGIAIGSGSGGEANTASNVGSLGTGVYDGKVGVDLQFRKLNAANNKLTVALNGQQIDFTLNEDNFTQTVLKSIIDASGDLIVGDADNSVTRLATPSLSAGDGDRVLTVEDTDDTAVVWKKRVANEVNLNYVNSSTYTVDYDTDHVIVGVYSGGDMTFTFPDPTFFPTTGIGRQYIFKNGDTTGNILTVKLYGTGTFQNGLNEVKIYNRGTLRMGMVRPNIADGAFLLQTLEAYAQVRRNLAWASSNFSSLTAIPFDTQDNIRDSNIISHSTSTNPERLTLNVKGEYKASCWFSVNSTGGSSWSLTGYIRKNGTDQVDGSAFSLGNYQTEDAHVSLGPIRIESDGDDYYEVVVDQNNLTGNIEDAVFVITSNCI